MKKTFTILLVAVIGLLAIGNVNAQDKKHQIAVGIGAVSIDELADMFTTFEEAVISLGSCSFENFETSGAINVTYNYKVSDVIHIGGAVTFESISKDVIVLKEKTGKYEEDFVTIAAECKFAWLNRDFIQLYSRAGVGITLVNGKYTKNNGDSNSDSGSHFNFQASLFGIRIGKDFGGYLELGGGYKGMVSVGLSLRL